MADETYEGWTNRETWTLACEIDNSPRLLSMAIELVFEADAGATQVVARMLEDWTHMRIVRFAGELQIALASCALARVNWRELAEHYIRKAAEGVR